MNDHDRLSEIFLKACALGPQERAAFLDETCGGNASLRREVEAMLSQDAGTGSSDPLDRRVMGVAETLDREARSVPIPAMIGRYRVLDRIGEGSMGVVYRARQESPDREVALKVIAWRAPTADLLRRFEVETLVLGRLQHPGIAQIIEAGVTDPGEGSRPFFAMEHVEGLPLTTFAERRGLGIRERVELMIRVCDGVQHAHQRGVIHRDLKPPNILVDGTGQPKILDFGVARVMEPAGGAMTAHTHHGALIGTLGYMSPEQVRGDAAEVDTRADVYSLGAVCYELLTGRGPHDLEGASLPEAIRRISEVPARRLSSAEGTFPSDLETIVGKALEPDRERRYESASELAADLRRFLADEPIAARSPSALYQVRKLVARNRLASGLVAALIVALAGFGIAMAIQAARIRAERDRAEREANIAGQVSKFLGDAFRIPSPSSAKGRTVTAREVLDRGVERIRGELTGAPQVRSRLTLAMADAYLGLGLQDEAERLFRETLETEANASEREPEVRVRAICELGWIYRDRGKYDDGLTLMREAEDLALAAFGPEHPLLARSLLVSGVLLRDKQDFDEAEERLDRAHVIYERTEGEASEGVGRSMYHKGWLLHLRKKDKEALKIYESACPTIERAVGEDHPQSAWCLNDLSVVLSSLNRLDEASAAMSRAVAIWERILPPDHPDLAAAVDNLGSLRLKARDFEGAAKEYRRGLDMRRRAQGPDHLDVARSLYNLALATRSLGRGDDAIADLRAAIEIYRKTVGPDHAHTHKALEVLQNLHWQRGEFEASLRINRELLESLERVRGPDARELAQTLTNQGETLIQLGRAKEAEPVIIRALAIRERAFGPEDPRIANTLVKLAQCREAQGMRGESEKLYGRACGMLEVAVKLTDAGQAWALHLCSRWARRSGDAARADALLAREIAESERMPGVENLHLYGRAVAAAHRGELDAALDLLRQSLERRLAPHAVDPKVDLAPLAARPEFRALVHEFGIDQQPGRKQAAAARVSASR